MMQGDKHKIFVCTSCRYKGTSCRPGFELIKKLQDAMRLATPIVGDDFEVSGIACMAGCDRPCTVAYRASGKATYLFGDIDPETDIEDLIAFARQYQDLTDGWCSSTVRPGKLRKTTLARIPSAMILTQAEETAAS